MIIKDNVISNSAIATWMAANAVPDYFASVTYSNYIMECKDADSNVLFRLNGASTLDLRKAANSQESISINGNTQPTQTNPGTVVKCGGGIMVIVDNGGYRMYWLITKNQDGKTVVIANASSNSTTSKESLLTSNIHAVAWGDVTTAEKKITYTKSEQNQTLLVPFTTYTKPDTVSYTPNAFYMPVGEYYSVNYAKFTADNAVYITNGYWAIKDA